MPLSNMEIAAQLDTLASAAPASAPNAQTLESVAQPEQPDTAVDAEAQVASDLEVKTKDSKKQVSWDDAIKMAPPEMADLMRGLRADYTKKTQELAAQRKEMQREREALARAQEAIQIQGDLPEWDPWDEGTVNARIEREVARRLAEALQPVRQEYEQMQTEEAYNSFLNSNPDFRTDMQLRSEVQKLLESNEALDLETAYWAVRGRRSKQQAAEVTQRIKLQKEAEKKAAMTATATPRRVGTPVANQQDLKKMSAQEIYRLAEAMNKR